MLEVGDSGDWAVEKGSVVMLRVSLQQAALLGKERNGKWCGMRVCGEGGTETVMLLCVVSLTVVSVCVTTGLWL